jgi:hypothetical protein
MRETGGWGEDVNDKEIAEAMLLLAVHGPRLPKPQRFWRARQTSQRPRQTSQYLAFPASPSDTRASTRRGETLRARYGAI